MSSIVPPSVMEVLEEVAKIFQEENIKICVKESAQGALTIGCGSAAGGMGGGLLCGKSYCLITDLDGLIGTAVAGAMTKDFKSLLQVTHEMDHEKQKKLFGAIQKVISIDISDVFKLGFLLKTSESIRQAVIHATKNFLVNEMSLDIFRG